MEKGLELDSSGCSIWVYGRHVGECTEKYNQQHLSYASKGSNSFVFQYAAGSFGWSFETVSYLHYYFSPFLLSYRLDTG